MVVCTSLAGSSIVRGSLVEAAGDFVAGARAVLGSMQQRLEHIGFTSGMQTDKHVTSHILPFSYPRAPSTQIVPTLGSKVFKWYLLWVIWSPRVKRAQ